MNSETPKPGLSEILQEARQFHESYDSLLMATARQDVPVATYAPYVTDEQGRFYIYVSELSAHTANLMLNPKASLLFIEDESQAKHLFGRKRVTYTCHAEAVPRDSVEFADIMDRFKAKHGKFMDMMRELRDFHLFRLIPEYATYVRGFAQAYEFDGEGLGHIRHVNDKGHRAGTTESAQQMDKLAVA